MGQGAAGDPDHAVELLWRETGAEPRPGPGLSLGRIVAAAVEVADAEGLEGLVMRKVADRLGFTAMSLYRHVPGRDHLIDLMLDAVLGERPLDRVVPAGLAGGLAGGAAGGVAGGAAGGVAGDWRRALEACAREGWELRRRHPWMAEVRGSRHLPGPNGVAHYEYMLSVVAGTGLRPSEVVAVVGLVGRFVDAEALLLVEQARTERLSGVGEQEWWGARDTLYARLDRYPTLRRLWESGGFGSPEDPFEFGLRRVLDGIEVLVQKRDETRDETSVCQVCGTPVEQPASGRPRAYCSPSCRQRAYRERRPATP